MSELTFKNEIQELISWVLEQDSTNTYFYNLQQVVKAGYCPKEKIGLLISAIPVMRRNKKQNQITNSSEFLMNVGDKFKGIEVTLVFSKNFETAYGTSTLLSFVDESGNNIIWFKSGLIDIRYKSGDKFTISGSVKDHKLYNDIKQTVVTRCKCFDTEGEKV